MQNTAQGSTSPCETIITCDVIRLIIYFIVFNVAVFNEYWFSKQNVDLLLDFTVSTIKLNIYKN